MMEDSTLLKEDIGDGMDKKCVLQVPLDDCTAKEAMKAVTGYMSEELLSTIEFVTADLLMQASEDPELREDIGLVDLAFPSDKAVLEVAEITDKKKIQEIENKTFLKMLMHYFHKNHSRVFVVTDTESETESLVEVLARRYSGIQVVDTAVLPETESKDDGLVNRINGTAEGVDCVIAVLKSPRQEAFLRKNKTVLDARVWVSVGKLLADDGKKSIWEQWKGFLEKKILKREAQKKKREENTAG